jgi:hypothetical protein
MRMIVCSICGNKRCPHATNHINECTNSNEVGQKGSSWEPVKPFSAIATADAKVYRACAGAFCGAMDGASHSSECQAEHAAVVAGGRFVKVVLDDERMTSEALLDMSDAIRAWRSEVEKYHQITSLALSAFSDGYEAGMKAILSACAASPHATAAQPAQPPLMDDAQPLTNPVILKNAREDSWVWQTALASREANSPNGPKLAVWYGRMPESNGKSNWTAILHNGDIASGITLDRSEYPDRVRYEADRARWLIGELAEEPWILDYDADMHSGYATPQPAKTFEQWASDPVRAEKIPLEMHANGAYKDSRTYLIAYGWKSALKHGASQPAQTKRVLTDDERFKVVFAARVLQEIEAGASLPVSKCSKALTGLNALLSAVQPASGDKP